jgi:hypothetical protein
MVSTADRDLKTNSWRTPLFFYHADEDSSKKLYLYTTPHIITDQETKILPPLNLTHGSMDKQLSVFKFTF